MDALTNELTDPMNLLLLPFVAGLTAVVVKPKLVLHRTHRRAVERMPRMGPIVLWIYRVTAAVMLVVLLWRVLWPDTA
ncbi:hypothetical protein FZ103_17215 [Streptomonospora sp. PA3]|uniref:hypothetical protein n=1 Tax=Streptomonospora sp. PA3 TaxID=2607326 RepID=UPI0012DF571B|nr:hypothetical protein [Streptomonospora sp. PA3]MUL42887.1 hypothetical protein [Streptomonospora sp. PA3]